jgi:hypothetical protein
MSAKDPKVPQPARTVAKAASRIDFGGLARRAVVAIAAGAGLIGILAERPVATVAWRASAVVVVGLIAVALTERVIARFGTKGPRTARTEVR